MDVGTAMKLMDNDVENVSAEAHNTPTSGSGLNLSRHKLQDEAWLHFRVDSEVSDHAA